MPESTAFWSGITALIALAGVLVAWLAYRRRQRPPGILEYEIEASHSVLRSKGRIKVLVDDQPSSLLEIVTFRFTNAGRGPVRPEDFAEPLALYSSIPTPVYSADVLGSAMEGRADHATVAGERVTIAPFLLNPGEHFSVRIVAELGDWKVRARLANSEARPRSAYRSPERSPSLAGLLFALLTTVLAWTLLFGSFYDTTPVVVYAVASVSLIVAFMYMVEAFVVLTYNRYMNRR